MNSEDKASAVARRLGAPACDRCGLIGAPKRIITVVTDNGSFGANLMFPRIETDFEIPLCSDCSIAAVGAQVFPAWGGVSTKSKAVPTGDTDVVTPYGVIRVIKPLSTYANANSIGVEMHRK